MNYQTIKLPLFGRSKSGRLLTCDLTVLADPSFSFNSQTRATHPTFSINKSYLRSENITPIVQPAPPVSTPPVSTPSPSPFFGLPVQHPVNNASSFLSPSNAMPFPPPPNIMAKPITSSSFSFCNSSNSIKSNNNNNNNNKEMRNSNNNSYNNKKRVDSIIPIEMLNKMPKVTESCLQKRLNMCHSRLVGNPCKNGLSLYSMLHKAEIKKLLMENGEKRNRNLVQMLYEQRFNSLSPTIRNEYEEVNKFLKELYSIETSQRQINQYEKSFGSSVELFYKKHYFDSLNNVKRVNCNNLGMNEIEYLIDTIFRVVNNDKSIKIDFNKVKKECEKENGFNVMEYNDYHNIWRYLAYGLENKCEEEDVDVDSDDEMITGRLSIRNEHRYMNHISNNKMKNVSPFSKSNKVKEITNTLKVFINEGEEKEKEENEINEEILKLRNELKNNNNNNKELDEEDIINNIIDRERELNSELNIESNEIMNKMSVDSLVFLKDICYINSVILNNNKSK